MTFFIGNWKAVTDKGNTIQWEFEWGRNRSCIENEIVEKDANGKLQFSNDGFIGWDRVNRRLVNWCVNAQGNRMDFVWEQQDDKDWNTWLIGRNDTWKVKILDNDTWQMNAIGEVVTYKRQD